MSDFEIDGARFVQQYRKCSRGCTHGQAGVGHGPYWYKSKSGESLKYLGAKLPVAVIERPANVDR